MTPSVMPIMYPQTMPKVLTGLFIWGIIKLWFAHLLADVLTAIIHVLRSPSDADFVFLNIGVKNKVGNILGGLGVDLYREDMYGFLNLTTQEQTIQVIFLNILLFGNNLRANPFPKAGLFII